MKYTSYKRKSKPFICDICGKDFDKENKLKKHYRDAHDKEYKKE